MRLKHCAIVTVVTLLLLQSEVMTVFMPLIAVIQNLSGGGKQTGAMEMPMLARVMMHPAFGIALFGLALACLGASVRGAKREPARRWKWIILAVLNALALFGACMALFVVPKFVGMFRDMGIR